MILLNTTFCISPIHTATFLSWVRECYLPAVTAGGGTDSKFLHLPSVENDSSAYAVQFCLPNESSAHHWCEDSLPIIIAKANGRPYAIAPDALLHFSTIMEILN